MADMKKINQKTEKISSKQMTRMVIVFIFFLYITWIGAWLLERAIESHSTLLLTSMSRSIIGWL